MPGSSPSVSSAAPRPTPAKAGRPERPASCPPRVVGSALDQVSNSADNGLQAPSTPILDAAWSGVITAWLTHAATEMRDAPDLPRVGVPTLYLWRAYKAAAWHLLPSTLSLLLESEHLCRLFGLDARLPDSVCVPLLDAVRGEMVRTTAAGSPLQQDGDALMRYLEGCMQQPTRKVLANPLLRPLFDALHEVALRRPALTHVGNVAEPAAGSVTEGRRVAH